MAYLRLWMLCVGVVCLAPVEGAVLTVRVEEVTRGVQLLLDVTQPRVIDLVPGLTYHVHCQSRSGFAGQNWVTGEGVAVVAMETAPAANESVVYASQTASSDANEWTLVLQLFDASMLGTYRCVAPDTSDTEDVDADLTIGMSNPTIVASSHLISETAGFFQPALAFFLLVSGTPQPESSDITWYFQDRELDSAGGYIITPSSLMLPNPLEADVGGSYACIVETSAGKYVANFTVTIITQPLIVLSTSVPPNPVLSDGTITLICNDTAGYPPPDFQWTHNDQPVEAGDNIQIVGVTSTEFSLLTIDPLRPEDEGEYKCTGSNEAGANFRVVYVNVQYKPILTQDTDSLQPIENSTVTLTAQLVRANPSEVTFLWKFGTSIVSSPRHSTTYVDNQFNLTISDLVYGDSGTYSVEVTNSIGTEVLSFTVDVQVPPILYRVTPSPSYATPGMSITFELKIVNQPNPPVEEGDIMWSGPDGSNASGYNVAFDGTTATLGISKVEIGENGTYTAVVDHDPNSPRSLQFELVVKYPPLPPSDIGAALTTPCTANVSWSAPPSNETVAEADYIIIQSRLQDIGAWEEVSGSFPADQGATEVQVPGKGVSEANYTFRGFSESKLFRRRGNTASEPSPPIVAYPRDSFPSVTGVTGSPVKNSTTIQVSWTVPDSSCYRFDQFQAKCTPVDGGATGEASVRSQDGDVAMSVDVGGLMSHTLYQCEVTTTLTDARMSGIAFDHMTTSDQTSTFTFPSVPSLPVPPDVPRDTPPDSTTITVQFALPDNQQDISHYWIVVLRLSSKEATPSMSPDDLYGADFQFATASEVNDPDLKEENYLPYIAAEVAADEFNADPTFVIGDGKSTVAGDTAYSNSPLVSTTVYTCFLRAFPSTLQQEGQGGRRRRDVGQRQYVVFSSSEFLDPPPETASSERPDTGGSSSSDDTTTITIGVVAAIFVVLIIAIVLVLIGVIYMCNSKSQKGKMSISRSLSEHDVVSAIETPDFQNADTPDLAKRESAYEMKSFEETHLHSCVPSGPISVADFPSHVEKFDANRQLLFLEEFEWITKKSPWHPSEASINPSNDEKNRYSNITAFDDTRVKLSVVNGDECSDYINANFINGYNGRREYIATQGPLEQTVSDFWRMVWEQGTTTIIMLTNLVEVGKVKCYQYWPTSGTKLYGGIRVTLGNSVLLPDYTIRSLNVESLATGKSRLVLQFHYTHWPDYGTPRIAAPLLNFLRAVRESSVALTGPIVVHCSAGVGRSGTVMCIDYCLHQSKKERFVDVRGYVSAMREQRNYMVQTEQQYTFIHYAILEALAYGDTSYRLGSFSSNYQDLQETNPETGRSLVEEEFIRLSSVRTMVKKSSFVQRVKPRSRDGNHRFVFASDDDAEMNLRAHFVDSYLQSRLFVVSDGPTAGDMLEFWQMVWDENVAIITMLTPPDAEYHVYWPASSDVAQHGSVIVKVLYEKTEHLYTVRTLKLTHAKQDISREVQLFQFEGWTMEFLPSVPTFVSFVSEVLEAVECFEKNQKLLIHDIESLGPSGVFCALHYCIERLRTESIVDIFQAVQRIQLQRPGMVESLKLYAFVYDCVFEYIRMHSSSK